MSLSKSVSITILAGTFIVMALSNAVVPILPSFAHDDPLIQGLIYSAYFFGAFVFVLPAGLLAVRFTHTRFMQIGLILTAIAGLMIFAAANPYIVILARFLEGAACGLFISPALSVLSSDIDHKKLSGYYFASSNAGLLLGLILPGTLGLAFIGGDYLSILLCAVFAFAVFIYAILSFTTRGKETQSPDFCGINSTGECTIKIIRFIPRLVQRQKWLFFAMLASTGSTGVVISLYPQFSMLNPIDIGILMSLMNIGTITTSLYFANKDYDSKKTIVLGILLMALLTVAGFIIPVAFSLAVALDFFIFGGVYGMLSLFILDLMTRRCSMKNALSGLFFLATYGGMALLPYIAGAIANRSELIAVLFTAAILTISAITVYADECKISKKGI